MPNNNHIIALPSKLKAILNTNEELETILFNSLIPFSHILKENKLYFFPEYTDHGINHIESVLKSIENLISDGTLSTLSANDVGILLVSTVLHDIGMHTSPEMFKNMIGGQYDSIEGNLFKEKTWSTLWQEYLKDCKYWGTEKKKDVFGNENYVITNPNLDDLQSLNEYDKKLIGEFIRINHPRIAYEIALKGFIGNITYSFDWEGLPNYFAQIAGLVARSHGMNVRDTFDYLKKKLFGRLSWKKPYDIKVVFLMTLIRLADYLQIDSTRINVALLNLKTIYSPYSKKELDTHKSIDFIQLDDDDKERIVVQASPQNAKIFVKIENLIQDIQKEFDISWAVLGEVYNNEYKLKYRRIVTNISDDEIKEELPFVPKQFGFEFNADLIKLLIAPLYGNNPSYAVRELVQNAVDACRTRMALDEEYKEIDITHVTVALNSKTKHFIVSDTGIGMSIEEIERYFLTIGSSYDSSLDWQKIRDINSTYRTGRFGIGILAAFLLGPKITVKTKSIKDNGHGYQFTISLNKEFIQIDKVSNFDYGTSIEIECESNAFNQLANNAVFTTEDHITHGRMRYGDLPAWFNWYVEEKPRIEYKIDKELIQHQINTRAEYNELHHTCNDFGEILWRPKSLFCYNDPVHQYEEDLPTHQGELYCNGFFVNHHPQKSHFCLLNLDKYHDLTIPSLQIADLYNNLPLNLQRNNIDDIIKYPFEKDLAIAVYKDILCQLLAIDLSSFKYIPSLFFNASGFTYNKYPAYPLQSLNKTDYQLYSENRFLNKRLIHIEGANCFPFNISFEQWIRIFNSYPDVFFSFYDISHTSVNELHLLADNTKTMENYYAHTSYGIDPDFISNPEDEGYLNHLCLRFSMEKIGGYYILNHLESNTELINSLIELFSNNVLLPYIVINEISDYSHRAKSDVDDFFMEYAGGDLIIPYDEANRRIKFAKVYEECSEDIEKYRRKYASK